MRGDSLLNLTRINYDNHSLNWRYLASNFSLAKQLFCNFPSPESLPISVNLSRNVGPNKINQKVAANELNKAGASLKKKVIQSFKISVRLLTTVQRRDE